MIFYHALISGSFPRRWSSSCRSRLAFLHNGFGSGLAENSDQLKNTVEPSILKPLIGLMLCNIVVTNQQIHRILDACHKLSLRFTFPDSSGDLWHRCHHLRHGRFFHLHSETKLFAKRPQATSKKLFYHIMTPDERSPLNKSCKISVLRTARRRNFCQIVQLPSFSISADRFFCLENRLSAPKAPGSRTNYHPNRLSIYSS
jgi:hypothetical protein